MLPKIGPAGQPPQYSSTDCALYTVIRCLFSPNRCVYIRTDYPERPHSSLAASDLAIYHPSWDRNFRNFPPITRHLVMHNVDMNELAAKIVVEHLEFYLRRMDKGEYDTKSEMEDGTEDGTEDGLIEWLGAGGDAVALRSDPVLDCGIFCDQDDLYDAEDPVDRSLGVVRLIEFNNTSVGIDRILAEVTGIEDDLLLNWKGQIRAHKPGERRCGGCELSC
ncbi:hypothetical protein IAR50_003074 [Cryptococcus sp. DSM 104548]